MTGTAKHKAWWERLRDPRWQQMRLRIMDRDKFSCRHCRSRTDTLNVHHGYYEKGMDPWEYPEWSLKTLCESCHENWHQLKLLLDKVFCQMDDDDGFTAVGYLTGIAAVAGELEDAVFLNPEMFGSYTRYWGLDNPERFIRWVERCVEYPMAFDGKKLRKIMVEYMFNEHDDKDAVFNGEGI